MADNSSNTTRRRGRSSEASARAEALERLKSLRQGGGGGNRTNNYQVRIETPIYDTIDEDEYESLVAKRREEARSFIVDDEGLGYGDEGEEEDWTKAGIPPSSDESDGEKEGRRKKKKGPVEVKEKVERKVSSSLSAAAAMMGKQRLSSMFTNSVFKKSRAVGADSIVDDVIAEFAPDEEDRERRRRGGLGSGSGSGSRSNGVGVCVKSESHSGNGGLANGDRLGGLSTNRGFESRSAGNSARISGEHVASVEENQGGNSFADEADMELIIKSEGNGLSIIEGGVVEEKGQSLDEVKEDQEMVVKKEEVRTLNARITDERDPALNATVGWKAMKSGESVGIGSVKQEAEEKFDFELEPDGSLPFHLIDVHEEIYGANMGTLYLFGKVKAGGTYHSCCVVVKNMQRCVYAIPNGSLFHSEEVMKLEKDAEDHRISTNDFRKKLQELASGLKTEIAKHLLDLNISTFSMAPVKRKYAFERLDIPSGENYLLKINYPFKDPSLPVDLKGETFSSLLGTHSSALEHFLVKRKIKGPCWLSITNFSSCPQRVSWCKFEVTVDCPKEIQTEDSSSSRIAMEIPPVVVTAINLKTILNEKQNVNEIVSASVICCHKVKIDTPMLASEWMRPGMLSHFSVVRKLDGGIFPMGFNKEAIDRNTKAGSNVLSIEMSERALLNRLITELHKLDSDVLVGHNISGFDLDVLLHRAQACMGRSNAWSKIGRLRRSVMPKLTKGNNMFGSGASPGIMSCIVGRLLCDTYLCSRDLLKEVSYSLTELAKTQLKKDRKEIAPKYIPEMFQTSESLMELIECGETDAWLSMELMFHLSVLPLTRQLTNISGNLWGRTLQGARAQRVEYLLLHAFHAKKFVVPDKITYHMKEAKLSKRRASGNEDKIVDELGNECENNGNDAAVNNHGKGKKGASYSGGLVLEPKSGLYDKYILLLDFNSLYPSIIQEYNICFTTVERPQDGSAPRLPSTTVTGVLPELLKSLVQRRRTVKSWMKNATGLRLQQFDIQQQALKLTANSMYGCLGFSNSRFYAKPLAELITLQGREILQSTVDLVQNNLNLEVIYGDTDSIMIYSGLDDIARAKGIAAKVIQEVNKKYRCLEIDLDGLYKRMLLLKKKKYAAVKVLLKDGTPYEVIERKGLDMVRRDWSLLAKELGDFCLNQILSGGSCEDVVESIHDCLTKVQEDMRNGQVALEKYIITKTLTKPPEAYSDAKNQPHVLVAQRLKQSGYTTGCSVGDTVPYVICCEQATSSGSPVGIAPRARHPDELKKDDGKWMIDIDYYLSQQIHPVVSRLCASIQGTSPERLADCLGLDSSKYRSKSSDIDNDDPSASLLSALDDDERYRGCEPLILSCPSCSCTIECPVIFSSLCTLLKPQGQDSTSNFWQKLRCPKCPEEGDVGRISSAMIANQVKRRAEGFISMYYKGLMMCDDETCKYTTRSPNLRVIGDSERGTICPNYPRCNGCLIRKYTEAELYKQLSYYCYVLDTMRCLEKVEAGARMPLEKELSRVHTMVDLAASIVQRMRDRCAFGWIQLKDLTVSI